MTRASCTLTWRGHDGPNPVDGSVFRPDVLCRLSPEELAATVLRIGRTVRPIGDLFEIEYEGGSEGGPAEPLRLTLQGAPVLDALGAQMREGELIIEGDAGDDLGASMAGGLIRVHGSAGHRVGGPAVTSKRGMTGGEIVIAGDAGDHAGLRMRRGLVAVGGACGASPGYRMLAGTVVVGRGPVDHPGLEMRRGTVLVLDGGCDVALAPEAFTGGVVIDASAIPAMMLVLRRLGELEWKGLATATDAEITRGRWRVFAGDRFELHKGELLQWVSPA